MYLSVKSVSAIKAASIFVLLFLLVVFLASDDTLGSRQQFRANNNEGERMKLKIPPSLKAEHEEIHAELAKALNAGGDTAKAAKRVAELLHPHFVKEEEFALPPLGLLPVLAEGKDVPEAGEVVRMTEQLKRELPQMLEEHKAVVAVLKSLSEAASREGKPKQLRFAEKLMLHAQNEEEVLYPAAILVGEHLRLKAVR